MKVNEIMSLPVGTLYDADEGCHLYLWTTNNFLPDALDVIKAWGFEYVSIITWQKDRFGTVFSGNNGALPLCQNARRVTL